MRRASTAASTALGPHEVTSIRRRDEVRSLQMGCSPKAQPAPAAVQCSRLSVAAR